uniref:CS domain-containing protein n=1 Tax=Kalanchoe fedtschenkoi TaxID=63787 RepID=A0A7N1A5P7_KALFE
MSSLSFFAQNRIKTLESKIPAAATPPPAPSKLKSSFRRIAPFNFPRFSLKSLSTTKRRSRFSCNLSTFPVNTRNYEFADGASEVELRVKLESAEAIGPKDIILDARETTLTIKVQRYGLLTTVVEISRLFDRIRPSETIWYVDENELVVSLKKQDSELKWPDIVESWESLTTVAAQLLRGTSIYLVGESTEMNQLVARELSTGLGYAPIATKELLETISNQTIDSWMAAEGSESVTEAESAVFESLSTQVRAVVGTLGGKSGAACRPDKWRHLYAGFTVWLSKSDAADEASAKEEARRSFQDSGLGYSNADVVVKLQGWDADHAKPVAQAALSALKQLVLSDKKLTGNRASFMSI